MARAAAVGIGVVAIALGLLARTSTWPSWWASPSPSPRPRTCRCCCTRCSGGGFTTRGAVWSVYGGLIPALLLVLLSPVVSGSPESLFPGVDFQYFPLQNPGLVSIPLGFLAGWLGTVTSAEAADEAKHAETEVRSLTGAGAV